MEDSKPLKAAVPKEGRVVELTPAMEITGGAGSKIIDLTNVLLGKPSRAETQSRPASISEAPEFGLKIDAAAFFDAIQAKRPVVPPVTQPADPVALKRDAAVEQRAVPPVVDLKVVSPAPPSKPEPVPMLDTMAAQPEPELSKPVVIAAPEANAAEPGGSEEALDLTDLVLPMDLVEENKGAKAAPREEEVEIEIDFDESDIKAQPEVLEAIEIEVLPDQPAAAVTVEVEEQAQIELTDRVDQPAVAAEPESAPDAVAEEEQDFIELTEIAAASELEAPPEATETQVRPEEVDDSIELTDIVAVVAPESVPALTPPEAVADIDEDDTIELTDIVDPAEFEALRANAPSETAEEQPGFDDDTIELTDIVTAAELAAIREAEATAAGQVQDESVEPMAAEDPAQPETQREAAPVEVAQAQSELNDDTIELTDIVDAAELAAMRGVEAADAAPSQDEAIELMDIVDPAEVAAALKQSETESLSDEDEELIELSDRVELEEYPPAPPQPAVEAPVPPPQEAAIPPVLTDQVLHLDQVLDHVRKNKEQLMEDITIGVEQALTKGALGENEPGEGIGLDIEEIQTQAGGASAALEGKALEQAVERVIQAKYGQTIEQLIAKVVEKVVTREIETLKRNLLEEDE